MFNNDQPPDPPPPDSAPVPAESPEVKPAIGKFQWLKEANREASETEANLSPAPSPEFPGFEPVEFQLANGNDVRIVFALFWERINPDDNDPTTPLKDYFIRVYSNEDCLSRRLEFQWEFRARTEFSLHVVTKIGDWLRGLIESRAVFQYDELEEFIEDFDATIAELSAADEDAVEHIEHLPELTDPEAFDKVDDSLFNDQNDSEPER